MHDAFLVWPDLNNIVNEEYIISKHQQQKKILTRGIFKTKKKDTKIRIENKIKYGKL